VSRLDAQFECQVEWIHVRFLEQRHQDSLYMSVKQACRKDELIVSVGAGAGMSVISVNFYSFILLWFYRFM